LGPKRSWKEGEATHHPYQRDLWQRSRYAYQQGKVVKLATKVKPNSKGMLLLSNPGVDLEARRRENRGKGVISRKVNRQHFRHYQTKSVSHRKKYKETLRERRPRTRGGKGMNLQKKKIKRKRRKKKKYRGHQMTSIQRKNTQKNKRPEG